MSIHAPAPAPDRTGPAAPENHAEERSAHLAVTVFPLIVLAAAAIAFVAPDQAARLGPGVNWFLGIIMFGMGLTLTLPDFAVVAKRPMPVALGVIAQYVIMPLLGLLVAIILQLPPELAAGVILVGSAPGGTSSNVVAYLSKADTALSVAMTTVSTLIAPLFTPLLTLWLAGKYMPVNASAMALSIVQIVLIPVALGLAVRLALRGAVQKILPALPWISVAFISLVVAAVVGKSADTVLSAGLLVLAAVVLHNGLGYAVGYLVARTLGQPIPVARTVSAEVGMQNSGLAATLAGAYLTPAAAVPAAVFSVWHNLSGAVLAMIYRHSGARHHRTDAADA